MRSLDGLVCPWGDDGCGQHLVDRCFLDPKHYVGGFERPVDTRAGFEVVRGAECSPFAVLNEHVHVGGLDKMVDGIRGQRSPSFPDS